MKSRTHSIMLSLLFCLIIGTGMSGQESDNVLVWPGDVNNNGVVNHVDLLYLGVAYSHEGEPRNQSTNTWGAFPLPDSLWEYDYLSGLNYCYADCNGDGLVDYFDHLVIENNYGLSHGQVDSDVPPTAVDGMDPQMTFGIETIIVEEGQEVTLVLQLGNNDQPVENFHGIAFSLAYNVDYIVEESLDFELLGNWVESAAGLPVLSIEHQDEALDKLEIGVTKTNASAQEGNGIVGKLSFIIIDDVPDAIDDEIIRIEDVFMADEYADIYPVLGGALTVEILTDDENVFTTHLDEVKVFPNPMVNGVFNLDLPHYLDVKNLALYDVSGKQYAINYEENNELLEVRTADLPIGVYILEIETNKGIHHQKVFVTE